MSEVFDMGQMWYTPGIEGPTLIAPSEREVLLEYLPHNGRVLELGSYTGSTAAWLCDKRPDIYLLAIDDFRAGSFAAAAWARNRRPNMNLWVGTAQKWLHETLWSHSFNLVLVDGDHSHEGCLADLKVARQVVLPGGVVAVHDYGPECFPGIPKAIQEMCADCEQVALVRHLICLRAPQS